MSIGLWIHIIQWNGLIFDFMSFNVDQANVIFRWKKEFIVEYFLAHRDIDLIANVS